MRMKKGDKATAAGRWTNKIVRRIGTDVPGKAMGEEPAVNTVLDSMRWKNFLQNFK